MYGRTVRSVLNRSCHAWTESANKTKAKNVHDSMIHITCFFLSKYAADSVHHRVDHRQKNPPGALPPRSNAIDATIHVATGIVTDRSTRHRTGPEHDARAGNAPSGITLVCAVHDRFGWRWIEGDTCKPQQGASSDPDNSRRFDRKTLPRLHGEFLFAIANERWMGATSDAAAADQPHHFGHGRLCTLM
jgi:hypothetical protein